MNIVIPGYDIEGEIGVGAMASVYLATQRSLERKVALKIMAAALAADPSFCERFLREGKTLARLSHPHTVTIHDIGNVGELYYMAMEYLPNGTLKERIAAGLTPEQGLTYIRQIASALGYAHAQGLVHRDVKPANILFRADGTAVLSDFGIAKSLDDRTQFTQAGFAVGTPSYMSPEQARGQEIDGRADLYALGVVLYEILVGKLPYNGTDALSTALAHLTEPLPELPVHHGRYQEVLRKLLAKDPAERFPDAAALLRALDQLPKEEQVEATLIRPLPIPVAVSNDLAGLTPVSIEIPTDKPQPQPVRQPVVTPTQHSAVSEQNRGPVLALAAVAVAVALAIGGASYWWLKDDAPAAPPVVEAAKTAKPTATPPAAQPVAAQADGGQRPLLMAGKKTLFQRVLSKPGAKLSSDAGGTAGEGLPAFSVLYVYQRKDVDGSPWLRVGAATDGRSDGWLPATQVIEFNCRFGDPETQPVMLRLQSSLVLLVEAALAQALDKVEAQWDPRPSVGIVLAAGCYPADYVKGDVIEGLDAAATLEGKVFHAGTALKDGKVVTAGGRVLCATAMGASVDAAQQQAYKLAAKIDWKGCFYRTDIGYRAIARERGENQ